MFIGYIPIARGTFASIFAAAIYYFFIPKGFIEYISAIFFIVFGLLISIYAEKTFSRVDDQRIVIDEFSCFFLVPLTHPQNLKIVLIGLLLYRLFDSIKPFYRKVQRLPKIGIFVDDFIAAVLSNVLLHGFFLIEKIL